MARKTATYIFCDGPNCEHHAEVIDNNYAPEHWYRVLPEKNGKYSPQDAWEFHTLYCMAKWAKMRNEVLQGKMETRSTPKKVNAEEEIMTAFKLEPSTELSVEDIIELTGLNKYTIYKKIKELTELGSLFQTQKGNNQQLAKFRINS